MGYKITLIRGDGIGPEVMDATLTVLDATGIDFEFEEKIAGMNALEKYGVPLPDDVLKSIKKNKVALKGPVTTPVAKGFRSVNVGIRQALELYANLRPAKSMEGDGSRYDNVDLVVIRENTEGLYSGVEHWVDKEHNAAESIKIITKKASERICRFAFEYAMKEGRKKVTVVHKANIMKFTDGLFLECGQRVAEDYPKIEFEDRIVDNMCMQLVKKPEEYDVLVLPNMFGDIVSDLCTGLVGGLGMAPGANIGDHAAVFEAVHGSAPKHAGKNDVNPCSLIGSSILMLKHLGEKEAAENVNNAVRETVKEGKKVTYDLGGKASTTEMAEEIARKVKDM